MNNKVSAIANPAAGRGKIRILLPRIREVFGRRGIADFFETTTAGEEAILAQRAIGAGCRTIIAIGGDGTCSQIANAIVDSQSDCALAVLVAGTGNDFAKTVGVSHYTAAQVAELAVRGQSTRIDVGSIDGRHFLNSCGFGFDASVLEASTRVKFLKGDAVYIYSALKQLFTYKGLDVSADRIGKDGTARLLMVTVSNGQFLGGAFKIAPHASVTDGALDVCLIKNSGILARIRLFAGALRGRHLGLSSVTSGNAKELTLTFDEAPAMELDGELRVARSKVVHLRCLPRALSVIAAPGAIS
ncbi:MAG: diacylglycerol/lipid kinase family protein [Gemmatimonadaceae bacterium]